MGWKFESWSGDVISTENPIEILIDTTEVIYANFIETDKPQYIVNAQVEGKGNIEISPFGGLFEEGDLMTVEVFPEESWLFFEWIGDLHDLSNPLNFNIDKNTEITAVLIEDNEKIFQAEEAVTSNGSVEVSNRFYTGNGYIKAQTADEFSISWDVYPFESKYYNMGLRYSLEGDQEVKGEFYVNDILTNRIVEFNGTDSLDNWDYTKLITYKLESGKNTIKIVTKDLPGNLYIDFLKIRGDGEFNDPSTDSREIKLSSVKEFKLYPNPGFESVYVLFSLNKEAKIGLSLYNLAGSQILNTYHNYPEGNHKILLLENKLNQGLYFFQMKADEKIFSEKLVIL